MRAGLRLLGIVAQLGLVLWIAQLYRIEELRRFDRLIPVVFVGFLVHALVPVRFRPPVFVLVSWVGVGIVLGVGPAAWLVATGLLLIGILHLPMAYGGRVALLLAAGGGLAAARAGRVNLPEDAAVMLPILGSMFMIRAILYAYDLRHDTEPKGVWLRLAYFFLLPNVCFPLFPAVDPRPFAHGPSGDDAIRIYQKGLLWIARGVLQIALYRLVYIHVLPAPTAVDGFWSLVLFMVGSYFIYIRISGIFHLIVGILCLFGYDLPETHHRYFFASSFTDFWHRINIYWTAFMTKVIYYPVLMRFRKSGATRALVLAITAVFVSTTLLHAYQWFWLRGAFLVTVNDAVFFGVLGSFVMLTALREARVGRRRPAPAATIPLAASLRRSFQVTGVFCVITIIWAFWNSPSVSGWWAVTRANRGGPGDWAGLVAALVALALLGGVLPWAWARVGGPPRPAGTGRWAAVRVVSTCAILLVAAVPAVQNRFGPRIGSVLATIDDDRFSQWDEDLVVHGYYEGLLEMNRLNSRVWESQLSRPVDEQPLRETDAVFPTNGVPGYELIPSKETRFRKTVIRTNRWGLRDRDYPKERAAGTFRIALLGSSYVMGWGVNNDEVFEAVLESRWNAERGEDRPRLEILNFAVGGYTFADQVALCESKVFEFDPDAVIYVAHTGMKSRELDRLVGYLQEGAASESVVLQDLLREIVVDPDLPPEMLRRQLRGEWNRLVDWTYRRIVEACRGQDAQPLFVFWPKIRQLEMGAPDERLVEKAEAHGFTTIVLDDAYGGWDSAAIQVAPWDFHPNPLGHRLVAENLYRKLPPVWSGRSDPSTN